MRYSTAFLLGAAVIAAPSRVSSLSAQTVSSGPGKGQHVASLRSSDSTEGSRVVLSSDQSLSDYEAYRRGDRFYVKIPAAEAPRAEALRGRGFADVKATRSGESTVISFRLLPGTTARVEQHSNRLEIVFTVPGGQPSVASNSGRDFPRPIIFSEPNRNSNANKRTVSPAAGNRNASDRSKTLATGNARPSAASNANNSNAARKSATPAASSLISTSKPAPTPSPIVSPTAKLPTPTPVRKSSPAVAQATSNQPTPAPTNQPRQERWGQIRERINYWILLAQLNPIPVAVGGGLLLLLAGLFLFQRRRAKATRRARTGAKSSKTAVDDGTSVQPAAKSKSEPVIAPSVETAAALTTLAVATASRPNEAGPQQATHEVKASTAVPVPEASPQTSADPRRERVTRVTEEAKKLMTGGSYDESIIGSSDPETRQLVGAELLAAIVGRNVLRREFAREAFMKHGYFDDATRDLRIAESENERAAAARRLSFVHDREATPHLIAALDDHAPDVRRTAVEALMDLRDPAAIAPLNALMQTENDRKVPRTLIKHAIDACATVSPDEAPSAGVSDYFPAISKPSSPPNETEREVIEL